MLNKMTLVVMTAKPQSPEAGEHPECADAPHLPEISGAHQWLFQMPPSPSLISGLL